MTKEDTNPDFVADEPDDFIDVDTFLTELEDPPSPLPVEEAWRAHRRAQHEWQRTCARFNDICWWDPMGGRLRPAADALDVVPESRWSFFREQVGADDAAFLKRLSEEAATITSLADRLTQAQREAPADPRSEDKAPQGMIVCPTLPTVTAADKKLAEQFSTIAGKHLPFASISDPIAVRRHLLHEFPWASEAIDALLAGTFRKWANGPAEIDISPTLLVGTPGCGKSRLLRRVGELLGLGFHEVSVAGTVDDHIFGVSRGWSTAMPSLILSTLNETRIANPFLILNEIDKPVSSHNGNLVSRLLPLLERSEARAWRENYLNATLDLSRLNWCFTANDLASIPDALRSRMRIVRVPQPSAEHLPILVQQIRSELAAEREMDSRWFQPFDPEVMEMLRAQIASHGSVRILRRQIEVLLDGTQIAAC